MSSHSASLHAPDALFLPWVESANDRRFKRILATFLVVFGLIGAVVPFLPTPEIVKKDLASVSPRITKLIMERKKQPPPPVPEEVKKKIEKKPEEKKTSKQAAIEKASKSGLVALSSELSELREGFDLPVFDDAPLQKTSNIEQPTSRKNILVSKAKQSSEGINTEALSRTTGAGELSEHKTTQVSSSIGEKVASVTPERDRNKQRDKREIEQVFQMNKGAIYSIYNRALRKDPTLQGKVIVELTISSKGEVTACTIVSSELNNPDLERKIVARIKLFKFNAGEMPSTTVQYPIDFFPS